MAGKSLTTDQILSLLKAGPARIAELTAGLPEAQLHAAPHPGEWSANEVLAHLRSCADVWGNCIMTMIDQDTPAIRAVNPRTWTRSTNYLEEKFEPSLQAFAAQRSALVAVLESLAPQNWLRSATITGAGKPLERTIQFYAEWMATHERPHLKQIQRIASTMRQE